MKAVPQTVAFSLVIGFLAYQVGGSHIHAQRQHSRELVSLTPEQREILNHMSIVFLDDGNGGTVKTIRFTGVNVQVVNGLGATNGFPDDPRSTSSDEVAVNGGGNLIIGYNENRGPRTGSHNLVVGAFNDYRSYGGFVAGVRNEIANVEFATIVGGSDNIANGENSTILGGNANVTSGAWAVIVGGRFNLATRQHASVLSGQGNLAGACHPVVVGGIANETLSGFTTICGGIGNEIRDDADFSVIVGGNTNRVLAGSDASVVVGGSRNRTSGVHAVVSGGRDRIAAGQDDWVAGSLVEDN